MGPHFYETICSEILVMRSGSWELVGLCRLSRVPTGTVVGKNASIASAVGFSGRTPVFGWRIFPDPCLIYG